MLKMNTRSIVSIQKFVINVQFHMETESQNHTESQNGRGWKGPLWVI